jgi:hypothetical protein
LRRASSEHLVLHPPLQRPDVVVDVALDGGGHHLQADDAIDLVRGHFELPGILEVHFGLVVELRDAGLSLVDHLEHGVVRHAIEHQFRFLGQRHAGAERPHALDLPLLQEFFGRGPLVLLPGFNGLRGRGCGSLRRRLGAKTSLVSGNPGNGREGHRNAEPNDRAHHSPPRVQHAAKNALQ